MKYECFGNGILDSNSYLVCGSRHAVIIDAGVPAEKLLCRANKLGLAVSHVLLTHGHFDHTRYVGEYRKHGIKVGVCNMELALLKSPFSNLSRDFDEPLKGVTADFTFRGGDYVEVGELTFKVLLTPGHTAGSCSFLCDNVCFTGDTLFRGSVGRTDFPTGSATELARSVNDKLLSLPPETIILPGHGEATTAGEEKMTNPYSEARC